MNDWRDDPRLLGPAHAEAAGLTVRTSPDGALRVVLLETADPQAARHALARARPLLQLVAGRHLAGAVEWFDGADFVGWAHETVPTLAEETGPQTLADATRYASQLALGLTTVSAAGLHHGGLVPQCVGLTEGGAVLLDAPAGVLRSAGLLGPLTDDVAALGELLRSMLAPSDVTGETSVLLADLASGGLTLRQASARLSTLSRKAARAPVVATPVPRVELPRPSMPELGNLFPLQPVVPTGSPVLAAADELPALTDTEDELDADARRRAAALDLDAIAYSASIHPLWAAQAAEEAKAAAAVQVTKPTRPVRPRAVDKDVAGSLRAGAARVQPGAEPGEVLDELLAATVAPGAAVQDLLAVPGPRSVPDPLASAGVEHVSLPVPVPVPELAAAPPAQAEPPPPRDLARIALRDLFAEPDPLELPAPPAPPSSPTVETVLKLEHVRHASTPVEAVLEAEHLPHASTPVLDRLRGLHPEPEPAAPASLDIFTSEPSEPSEPSVIDPTTASASPVETADAHPGGSSDPTTEAAAGAGHLVRGVPGPQGPEEVQAPPSWSKPVDDSPLVIPTQPVTGDLGPGLPPAPRLPSLDHDLAPLPPRVQPVHEAGLRRMGPDHGGSGSNRLFVVAVVLFVVLALAGYLLLG